MNSYKYMYMTKVLKQQNKYKMYNPQITGEQKTEETLTNLAKGVNQGWKNTVRA